MPTETITDRSVLLVLKVRDLGRVGMCSYRTNKKKKFP